MNFWQKSQQIYFSAELAEDGVLELEIDLAGILQPPKMSGSTNIFVAVKIKKNALKSIIFISAVHSFLTVC